MTTLELAILALPATAAAAYTLNALLYRRARHAIAHRLRRNAQLFERSGRHPELIEGLRYAADQTAPSRNP